MKHFPPQSFLEPEVRLGQVQVTREMKELWAIQIDLMLELLDVCRQLGITVYADGGTMLGAVRHQGFIPWDDDIDMAMLRPDYDKLMAEGPALFKEPYFLQNIATDPHYSHRHAQLRNTRTACWPRGKKPGTEKYCQGVFIDIFVADAMPNDPRHFARHFQRVRHAKQRLRMTCKFLNLIPESLYRFCRNRVPALSDLHQYHRYEALLRSVPMEKSSTTCEISFRHTAPFFPTCCFDKPVMMPFEYTEIPVMADAHQALRLQYGDSYMTPQKLAAFHSELEYDVSKEISHQ